jgi:hypothetical protein
MQNIRASTEYKSSKSTHRKASLALNSMTLLVIIREDGLNDPLSYLSFRGLEL